MAPAIRGDYLTAAAQGLTGVALTATLCTMIEPMLSPGEVVQNVLGLSPVAAELRLNRSTVWRWTQPAPRGTNGLIPACYHRELLQMAKQRGKRLTSADLVLGRMRKTGAR